MSKRIQKPISVLTSITTAVWLSGVAMLAPMGAMAAVVDGDIVSPDAEFTENGTTYYPYDVFIVKMVGSKTFKRLILNPEVFESYGHLEWGNIQTISASTVEGYTTSNLVREINDTKVYKLIPDGDTGTKQWLNITAAEFESEGYDWDSIYIINATDRDNYTTGSNIVVGGEEEPVTESTGTLTVSLAADTPASGQVVENSARVPFTKVNLTATGGDVIVDSMTIKRGGLGQDAAFSTVAVIQDTADGVQLGNNKSFNATHDTTLNDDLTVANGTTKSIYLVGNMASSLDSYAGETPTLGLSAITLSGSANLNATLPVTGNYQTLNATITIGTATVVAGGNAPSASTQNVGVTDYIVTSIKVTAGSAEAMNIEKIIFTQDGSAGITDVANLDLINSNTGEVLATIKEPTGKEVIFTPNLSIAKGKNVTFDLRLDIVDGSGRAISYDIDENTDILAKGQTYGYYVVPTYTGTTARPYYNPADTTIGDGSLRIESVAVSPTNIPEDSSDLLLGKFKFVVKGEEVKITSIGWDVKLTRSGTHAASTTDVTNITIYDESGTAVAGPMDPTHDITDGDNTYGAATTTDTIIVPVGETIYSVKGDLSSDFVSNYQIQMRVAPNLATARGMTTDNSITPTPATWISSTNLTIKAAALTITVSSDPAAQTVVAGTQDFTLANYILDATDSGSDIKVTQVKIPIHTDATTYPSMVSDLDLWDGDTEISVDTTSEDSNWDTTANNEATTTLTLTSGALVISAGTTKTITVKGDLGTGVTSGDLSIGLAPDGIVCTDADGNTVSESVTGSDGQSMTLSSGGTLNMSALTDPSDAIVVAGSDGVAVGKFTLQAKYEDITVNYVGINASSSHKESVCPGETCIKGNHEDVVSVSLYEDGVSTALGTVDVIAANATITPSSALTVPGGTTKNYTLKAKFANLNDASPAASGETLHLSVSNLDASGVSAGSSSITVNGLNDDFSTFTLHKSTPTVTMLPFTGDNMITANSQVVNLIKFKVTADSAGPVGLYKFTFGISTTTVNLNASTTNAKDASGFYVYMSSSESTDGDLISRGKANGANKEAPLQMVNQKNDINAQWSGETKDQLVLETWFDIGNDESNTATEHIIINAGDTKYFTLKGTIKSGHEGTTADNESIATVLAGDEHASATANKNASEVHGVHQNDFIWSDFNADRYATTTATNTNMFYNGFRLSGLDNTSSTAQVITD